MTLTTSKSSETTPGGDVLRRCYAMQIPRWQKFQSTLLLATTTQHATSKVGYGGEHDIPYLYSRQYSHVYHQRLSILGPRCWVSIQNDDTIHVVGDNHCQSNNDETRDLDITSNNPNMSRNNDVSIKAVVRVDRVLELKENVRSVVVGTLVKESTMSTIIDGEEASNKENKGHEDQIHPQSACSKTDQLYLEDESGRVALEFVTSLKFSSYLKHQYCSGIVVGLLGKVSIDGTMMIEKLYQPVWDSPTTSSIVTNSIAETNDVPFSDHRKHRDSYLLIVSGLDCGHQKKSSMPREMLLSFLHGALGALDKAVKVSHIVCCGGLIAPPSNVKKLYGNDVSSDMISSTMDGCRELDSFCYQIIYEIGIPLTILPGKDDPTTANWPQRPIHRSFLSVSTGSMSNVKKLLSIVPNPYAALYQSTCVCPNDDGDSLEQQEVQQYVIGTDGTNVQDLVKRLLVPKTQEETNKMGSKQSENENDDNDDMILDENDGNNNIESSTGTEASHGVLSYEPITELDALEYTLRWGHICPTGPDTVPTIPHGPENPDPMVMQDSLPSIYFAGNCSKFSTRLIDTSKSYSKPQQQPQRSRLICIPKFSNTGEAVMVNLRTLQVELLRFTE